MSKQQKEPAGYGNIYTPHAGSMIIQVQRESGLANRTIVLTPRQVKLLRFVLSSGGILLAFGAASWIFLASQAARVPFLTNRLDKLQEDSRRLDTLQSKLVEMDRRFQQVQEIMGATPMAIVTDSAPPPRARPPA